MKKLLLLGFILVSLQLTGFAQLDALKKAGGVAAASSKLDVASAVSGVMGKLTPALALTEKQQSPVQEAIKGYFTQKANILPMQASSPDGYNEKQRSYFGALQKKLGAILLQNQMNKFLGLKPAKPDPKNVLSQLFF